MSARAIFEAALGTEWPRLPDTLRALHAGSATRRFVGTARVARGRNLLTQAIASLFGFPRATACIAVAVMITSTPGGEVWVRRFGAQSLRSHVRLKMRNGDCFVCERLGALDFELALRVADGALHFGVRGARMLGAPLPRFLLPRSDTREYERDGRFHFDVAIQAPFGLGLIVHYEGALTPAP